MYRYSEFSATAIGWFTGDVLRPEVGGKSSASLSGMRRSVHPAAHAGGLPAGRVKLRTPNLPKQLIGGEAAQSGAAAAAAWHAMGPSSWGGIPPRSTMARSTPPVTRRKWKAAA